jgi:hypothetical protein
MDDLFVTLPLLHCTIVITAMVWHIIVTAAEGDQLGSRERLDDSKLSIISTLSSNGNNTNATIFIRILAREEMSVLSCGSYFGRILCPSDSISNTR